MAERVHSTTLTDFNDGWGEFSYISIAADSALESGDTIMYDVSGWTFEDPDYLDRKVEYFDGTSWEEIDSDVRDIGEGLSLHFALQEDIGAGVTDTTNYRVFWRSVTKTATKTNRDNIYLFYHDCNDKINWNDYFAVFNLVGGEFVSTQAWWGRTLNTTDVGANDVVVYGKVMTPAGLYPGIGLRSDAVANTGWTVFLDPALNQIHAQHWTGGVWDPGGGLAAYVCNVGVDYIIKCKVVGNNYDAWASPRGTPIAGAALLSWINATSAANRNVGFIAHNSNLSTFDDLYVIHAVTNEPTITIPGENAELSVAVGEITVNAVNKIGLVNELESRLCPVGDEIWAVQYAATGAIRRYLQSDLSLAGTITLQWTGFNTKWYIFSLYVVDDYIYCLVDYRLGFVSKAIGKWDLDGNLVDEFIDYVSPPADGELWDARDMVCDGSYLYIPERATVATRAIKKFDMAGNFVAKTALLNLRDGPSEVCFGQDGYLYASGRWAQWTVKIDPATMAIEAEVNSESADPIGDERGGIASVDETRIYKLSRGHNVVRLEGVSGDGDIKRVFGGTPLYSLDNLLVATGRKAGSFSDPRWGCGLVGEFIFVHDMYCTIGGTAERTLHKIYVKENRTAQTSAPIITGEADLKNKLRLVNPSYLRLAVQDDADGDEITYYRSANGTDWTEVTRASSFDLSGHSASDPLYLKIHLDNLFAKVGDPKVYGIDIVAEGTPIPTLGGGLLW